MTKSTPSTTVAEAVRPFYAGVDVGGTNIKFGLVDDQGRTFADAKIATQPRRGADDAVRRMAEALRQMADRSGLNWETDVAVVGLATPGMMDIARGMLLDPPNLPTWGHYPIRDRLSEAVGKKVVFANDANAAAFGEYWVGSGRNAPSLVMLTLGTGVGGGIIVGDVSIDGEHSHGSECGHIIIDCRADARLCPCGHRGHLEAYASATALIKRAEELLQTGRETSIRHRMSQGAQLTPILLGEEASAGDAFAMELIMELATYLGVGVATLVHTIDPGAVVLGGAMNFGGNASELGRRFLQAVRDEFHRRTFPVLAKETIVDFARLGGDAGYVGAAGIARARHRSESHC